MASDQGPLFANRNIYSKYHKNEKSTPDTPKIENGLVQLIRMDRSTRQMLVNLTSRVDYRVDVDEWTNEGIDKQMARVLDSYMAPC